MLRKEEEPYRARRRAGNVIWGLSLRDVQVGRAGLCGPSREQTGTKPGLPLGRRTPLPLFPSSPGQILDGLLGIGDASQERAADKVMYIGDGEGDFCPATRLR